MARQMIFDSEAYEVASSKIDQAMKLAEMISLYDHVNEQCEDLVRNAGEIVRELLESAHAQLQTAKFAELEE